MTEVISPKRKRSLLTLDLGSDLRPKVDAIAEVNNITASHAVRMLVAKALATLKAGDRTITIKIPETSVSDNS